LGNGNGDLVVKAQGFGNMYLNLNTVVGEGWISLVCKIQNLGGGEISRKFVEETQITGLIIKEGGR